MRTCLKILTAAALAALFAFPSCAASPADAFTTETREEMQERCEKFIGSLSFLAPDTWDESECETAYFAYCEGWGVEKDVQKGLDLLQKSAGRGLALPMTLLADVRLNGYYGTREDFEAALRLYARSYDMAADDISRARIAQKISSAYLEHSGSSFASYYAVPWIRLYLINGGTEEDSERMADLLLQCEEDSRVYDAGELIGEFKDGMIDYHKNYSGRTITVRGRVAKVSKGTFSGTYTVKLLPAGDIRQLLPGFLSGFAKLTEEDNSTVSSLLSKASKGASLWNEYRNTVECVIDGAEAEALETAETVMLRGTYALGTSLLPKIKDCELYIEPPVQAPEPGSQEEGKPEPPVREDKNSIQI